MSTLEILLIALILDYFIGDPDKVWTKIPHPAVLMGNSISWFDKKYNFGSARKIKGLITIFFLSLTAYLTGALIHLIPDYGIIELVFVTILLAHNSLIKHVRDVAKGLNSSLNEGRNAVACIVGRQTKSLDESNVSRAAVESAAENFSDAVIAPAFWYMLLGLPGLFLYKMVNTADSMVGYKSAKYLEFGFGSAKLDDLLNLIPARFCGALMCLVHFSLKSFNVMIKEARFHASPNAGWPEAAMASVLNVALSGPRIYDGKLSDDDFINETGRYNMERNDIINAIKVLNKSWIAFVIFILILIISS
ncbi:adenosylcobinamide-phosphate synthase CbiB [Amylibacter sp.]|nr:adenosylcobinamide-phosphate synthase CbiB [Amylibacter sp.]